jgi:SAM-dependent methyltransferase
MDDERQSTALFDAMAAEYDVLEPWYEHLYARLHAIVRAVLARADRGTGRALDAGCGHGFQTALLRELGWTTHGVDLAGALLAVARRRVPAAALTRADVAALPYPDGAFDVVSCCGSTLSFVADPDTALAEIARVLRPGGRLLVEYEHRWSLDLLWMLASGLTGDALGYGVSAATLWPALRPPWRAAVRLPYPGYGTLTLFSTADMRRRLQAHGLSARLAWGIHAATNLIPSTVLHRPRLPRALAAVYRALCALDGAGTAPPLRAIANSVVVLAVKR